MPDVILVNELDEQVGTMEKMQAHETGVLHRAFSVFIFDSEGRMLLQQRSDEKYHNGGMWSNACCSHPYPGEETITAAQRRLQEELGFTVPLKKAFDFVYNVKFSNGLTEHEFDHVFVGYYNDHINFDPSEVKDYSFKTIQEINHLVESKPELFTEWFLIAYPGIQKYLQGQPSLRTNSAVMGRR
jgi:isopentenyl-diphosphate Delta-isomerase